MKTLLHRAGTASLVFSGLILGALSSARGQLKSPASAGPTTHLFWNWGKVEPGDTKFPLDRTQLSAESLRIIEKVASHSRIEVADGPTPPSRFNTASGVHITIEKARKIGPWLRQDRPWESMGIHKGTVLWDRGKFRMWYGATYGRGEVVELAKGVYDIDKTRAWCYAESEDGITWRKPALGLTEFAGSRENNIISTQTSNPLGGGSIFVDPTAPPAERYKMMTTTSMLAFGAQPGQSVVHVQAGSVSADGLHWRRLPEPLWKGHMSDTFAGLSYDESLGRYVGYFRTSYARRRSIGRSETIDFARWPIPVTILAPHPADSPSDDLYTNGYGRYPGVPDGHLILSSVYHRDVSALDVRLATSLDNVTWGWTSQEPIIERGARGEWDSASIYVIPGIFRLGKDQVAVPFIGYSYLHNEYWRVFYQSNYPVAMGMGWAVWQDGRLAGIEARQQGEFTTLPLVAGGEEIRVNARANEGGFVRVELVVGESAAPATFRAREILGDQLWPKLEWQDPIDLRSLAGQRIRLRFRLYNAKVFAVRL